MEFKHELVLPNEDLPFKLFLFEGSTGNYRVEKHWHRSVEIFLVMEGTMDFYVNSRKHSLKEWEFVIVNSNEIHSIEAPTPNITLVLQIPLRNFEGYGDEEDFITFGEGTKEGRKKLIEQIPPMYEDYEKKEYGYILKVKGRFLFLLYLLVTEFQERTISQEARLRKRRLDKLSHITAYLKENYKRELTLEEVAGQFGFSPAYLSRMFRQYAGINYKTYLINLRTEFGRKELLNTDHTIGEVAFNQGFPSSRAFARAFLKRYGCLPLEYRRNCRKDVLDHGKDKKVT